MLAIDTTDRICSVSCKFNDQVFNLSSEASAKNTDVVLHMILSACAEFDRTLKDLEKIIVTVGPGSFTGVRVGVMIAKTLAFAHGSQLYPITSSLAQLLPLMSEHGDGRYLSLIDARMQECYLAAYQIDSGKRNLIIDDHVLSKDKAFEQALSYDFVRDNFQNYQIQTEYMLDAITTIKPVTESDLLPLYLRQPV